MKRILASLVLLVSRIAFGAEENRIVFHDPNFSPKKYETNMVFITDNSHRIFASTPITEQMMREARQTRESLPANDFPEGNWGDLTGGAQISLRLEKSPCTNGEPINAIVLVRNVTNEVFLLYNCNKVQPGLWINFTACNESGQPISAKLPYGGILMGNRPHIITAGTQRKYLETVNDTLVLTNGNYWIQASVTATHATGTNSGETFEITSAKVPVEIK